MPDPQATLITTPKLPIEDFQSLGYLQEVNRRFFHPLGLALAVGTGYKRPWWAFWRPLHGPMHLYCIWDARDDIEGYIFAGDIDKEKAEFVSREWFLRAQVRQERLGFIVEPVSPKANEPPAEYTFTQVNQGRNHV